MSAREVKNGLGGQFSHVDEATGYPKWPAIDAAPAA